MSSKKNLLTIVLTSLLFAASAVLPASAQDDPYADFTLSAYEEPDSSPEAQAKFADLKKAAESGDAEAQEALGRAYKEGTGVEINREQAVFWFEKAAEQNEPNALFRLGICNLLGYGVPANVEKALACLERAAEMKHSESILVLPILYFSGKYDVPVNKERGFAMLRTLASSPDASLDHLLQAGSLFLVEKQYAEARKCFLPAAEQGSLIAQKAMATCCLLEEDFNGVAEWLRRAAEQGDEEAKKNLPEIEKIVILRALNREAESVPAAQDNLEKFEISLLQDSPKEENELNIELEFNGTGSPDFSPEAQAKFAEAEKTVAQNLFGLGGFYLVGYGVPANKEKALAYLETAAEMKHEDSLTMLGSLYVSGKYGVPVDKEKGLALLRSAVNFPDAPQARLMQCGFIFLLEKQYADAKKCLLPLAEQGNLGAQKAMMMCCISENDVRNAAEWCRRAAEQGDADAKAALPKFEEALKNKEQADSAAVPAPQGGQVE